jgi:hypothetical protein
MFTRWSAIVLLAVAIGAPVQATASGTWRWPVDGDAVLPYGASYVGASGQSCTHGGLDIGAPAGTRVRAAATGEVTFSGLVPAGEGARTWAVTVLTSGGLRVTYLPLTRVDVRKGQELEAGQDIGSLAGAGDASGGGSHLHLGVKRGEASLDPLGFLGARGSAPVPGASPGVAGSPAGAPGSRTGSSASIHRATSSTTSGMVRVPSGSTASGPARSPQATIASEPRDAVLAALRTLSGAPRLNRIEHVAATPVLSLARIQADWAAARAAVLVWATRVGILLAACACIWPVLRSARAAGAQAVPAAVRHEER